jgi:hypothetical protein
MSSASRSDRYALRWNPRYIFDKITGGTQRYCELLPVALLTDQVLHKADSQNEGTILEGQNEAA